MAGTVEAISANAMLLIQAVRNPVKICLFRHRLMKGGIENSNHRDPGHQFLAGINSRQIGRVVKRRQVGYLFNRTLDFFCDPHRFGKFLSPMHDPMADGADFF